MVRVSTQARPGQAVVRIEFYRLRYQDYSVIYFRDDGRHEREWWTMMYDEGDVESVTRMTLPYMVTEPPPLQED